MLACKKGIIDLVRGIIRWDCNVDKKDIKNKNALHYAIEGDLKDPHREESRIYEIVKLLVDEKNIDINNESIDKKTPLIKAVEYNFSEIVRLLLKKSQHVNSVMAESG